MDARLGRGPAPSWVLGLLDRSVLLSLPGYYRLLGTPARDRDLHRAGAMAHSEPDPRVQPCDDRLHDARGRRHVPAGARVDRPRRRGVHRRRRVRMRAVPCTAVVPPAGARVGMDAGRLVRLAPVPGDAIRARPGAVRPRVRAPGILERLLPLFPCDPRGRDRRARPVARPERHRSAAAASGCRECGHSRCARASRVGLRARAAGAGARAHPRGHPAVLTGSCRHTHTSARACGRGGTCCRLVATSRSCFPV